MLFYRYLYDTFAAGETKTFTVTSPVPRVLSILRFFHLDKKDAYLTIDYKRRRWVTLDTTSATEAAPGFPLDLLVEQRSFLVVSIKNTKASEQDIFLSLVFDSQADVKHESKIKISSYAYTAEEDSHVVLTGIARRRLWIDALYQMAAPPDDIKFYIDGTLIDYSQNIPQSSANHNFYFLLEHPLDAQQELIYEPFRVPPVMDTRLVLLYHELDADQEVEIESSPFPFFPVIPPYPYLPYSPTPFDPTPPYIPIPDEPPIDPNVPIIPYDPVPVEDWDYAELEDVPYFKTPIPIAFTLKNRISNQPFAVSALRPSFFPSASTGIPTKVGPNFQKTLSHLLGEALFNTVPLRCTETGQLITTNLKDDYQVLSYQHTDADYHDYFFYLPLTHISLKTGTAAWKVRIFTVYKWLSQYLITDMDEIDLAADTESFFPFYAVAVSLSCPTASGGSPQTITGMVEF